MNELPSSLDRSYHQTTYWVQTADECVAVRLSEQPNQRMDALLEMLDCKTFAIITSDNPKLQRLSEDENEIRHARLERIVAESQFESRPTRHVADDSLWPIERGVAVFGLSEQHAEEWGRRFEQIAVIFGDRGQAPKLVTIKSAAVLQEIHELQPQQS